MRPRPQLRGIMILAGQLLATVAALVALIWSAPALQQWWISTASPVSYRVVSLAASILMFVVCGYFFNRLHLAMRPWMRRQRGECHACGYDRRALAPGAVCPECGTAPSAI